MRERESLYKRRRERNERVLVSGVVYREGQRGSGMFLHVEFRLDFRVVLGPFRYFGIARAVWCARLLWDGGDLVGNGRFMVFLYPFWLDN